MATLQGTKTKPRKRTGSGTRGSQAKMRKTSHTAGSPGATGTQVKAPVGGR